MSHDVCTYDEAHSFASALRPIIRVSRDCLPRIGATRLRKAQTLPLHGSGRPAQKTIDGAFQIFDYFLSILAASQPQARLVNHLGRLCCMPIVSCGILAGKVSPYS